MSTNNKHSQRRYQKHDDVCPCYRCGACTSTSTSSRDNFIKANKESHKSTPGHTLIYTVHIGNAGEDSRKPLANFQSTRRSAQKKDVGSA
jgi:hypothetical protein